MVSTGFSAQEEKAIKQTSSIAATDIFFIFAPF
jgi:hypothetical protein